MKHPGLSDNQHTPSLPVPQSNPAAIRGSEAKLTCTRFSVLSAFGWMMEPVLG